ncbi:hypothetical protein BHM03_00012091 [Ensete ventricosum]|nr:hypothetical protein BHM03_00012091 [Ensete ventricosum]
MENLLQDGRGLTASSELSEMTYTLTAMDKEILPQTWHVSNLKKILCLGDRPKTQSALD